MKKIKINIDRAPVSKEEIESKRNFEQVLKQVMAYSKPFYQTNLFLNSILVILFATVVGYTVVKLNEQVQEEKTQENNGYVQKPTAKRIGLTDSLQTQEFVVQIDRDTVLNTAEGAVITIPAGTLQAADKNVVLEVKEAYTMEAMIRAGLTTKTGKEFLSSGGMFYIQAKDSAHVKIAKPLAIDIPAEEVDTEMKLFSGQKTASGRIDWQNPVELKKETPKVVSEGEQLFNSNCKSCHRLGEDAVGPDLAYIGQRRDFDWIVRYVHNSRRMIDGGGCAEETAGASVNSEAIVDYSNDAFAVCLYNAYNKAEMTSFLTLSEKDIKAICNYCNDESKRLKLSYPKDELYINYQKCKTYKKVMADLNARKTALENKRAAKIVDNGPFVKQVDRSMQILRLPNNVASVSNSDRKSYVYPANQLAEYYQVEINTFGWYNIDRLAKDAPGVKDSKLIVQLADSLANKFQIYLVIPDTKIYGAGGLLKDKKDQYGFYEDDGSIKLPQGKTAHVYLVGEQNGQLLYAATTFIIDTFNTFRLNPALISKETFNAEIKQLLQTEGMTVQAKDSKNAAVIRKTDTELDALKEKIKEAEKLKPSDCDCGCKDEADYVYNAN
ncbi:MAG: c-type cytochrome [Cytophaga sp.]|uniref:c-type cytochrome n=1 Tax=Cytophaga sp. TaxID=29535 RepID=UPI003F7EC835